MLHNWNERVEILMKIKGEGTNQRVVDTTLIHNHTRPLSLFFRLFFNHKSYFYQTRAFQNVYDLKIIHVIA